MEMTFFQELLFIRSYGIAVPHFDQKIRSFKKEIKKTRSCRKSAEELLIKN
ncbi:MAG: hypothetical protein Mars2KO_37180 [Maribacter sp.]